MKKSWKFSGLFCQDQDFYLKNKTKTKTLDLKIRTKTQNFIPPPGGGGWGVETKTFLLSTLELGLYHGQEQQ